MSLPPLSAADAASELQRRRHIRRDFGAWCRYALKPLGHEPAKHHDFVNGKLQAVADGKIRKLMISLPPGSAKSTYGSQLFPAWLLSRPNINIIGASHTTALAERFSGKVQSFLREGANVLGASPATEAKEMWATTLGGEYRAAGVGVGIAGFRADFGIIDDPLKSRQDADSETVKGRIWDWYGADFMPRLKPGASQIIIGTRWAEDDLHGRLLEAEPDEWDVINIPAIAGADDPLGRALGEPLWSDGDYGYGDELEKIRAFYQRTANMRDWSALYQGRPAPEEGNFFKGDWLVPVPRTPPRDQLMVYGASDYAVTEGKGDWTVHVVVGIDHDENMYLLDLWRERTASDQWVEAFCDLVEMWRPVGWAEETGQIKSGVGPFLVKRMLERGTYVARESFPTRGDKAIRAQSIRGRMAMRGLRVLASAPWLDDFRSELLTFPAAKHDDQVDALGLVGQIMDKLAGGRKPPEDAVRLPQTIDDLTAPPIPERRRRM